MELLAATNTTGAEMAAQGNQCSFGRYIFELKFTSPIPNGKKKRGIEGPDCTPLNGMLYNVCLKHNMNFSVSMFQEVCQQMKVAASLNIVSNNILCLTVRQTLVRIVLSTHGHSRYWKNTEQDSNP